MNRIMPSVPLLIRPWKIISQLICCFKRKLRLFDKTWFIIGSLQYSNQKQKHNLNTHNQGVQYLATWNLIAIGDHKVHNHTSKREKYHTNT